MRSLTKMTKAKNFQDFLMLQDIHLCHSLLSRDTGSRQMSSKELSCNLAVRCFPRINSRSSCLAVSLILSLWSLAHTSSLYQILVPSCWWVLWALLNFLPFHPSLCITFLLTSIQDHFCHPGQRRGNSCLLHFYIIKICSTQASNLPPIICLCSYGCNLKNLRYKYAKCKKERFFVFLFVFLHFNHIASVLQSIFL